MTFRSVNQPDTNYNFESLKRFVNSFQSIPYIYERDQTNLIMDLSHNQIEYLSSKQIFLWLPRFWFTNDTKINRRTRFFSHQFIGIKEGFFGFDATKLFKRSLRKNKVIELSNLQPKYKHQYAFIEVHQTAKDEEVIRWKRSQDGSCSLQSTTVNLTDIGWDMVISPSQLQYKYCSGECNVRDIPARMFLKSHGQIRYKLQREGTVSLPPACCSPSHYEPVIMLYLDGVDDDGRQIIRRGVFEETLASSCGCG